jgi:hypothetical protein
MYTFPQFNLLDSSSNFPLYLDLARHTSFSFKVYIFFNNCLLNKHCFLNKTFLHHPDVMSHPVSLILGCEDSSIKFAEGHVEIAQIWKCIVIR